MQHQTSLIAMLVYGFVLAFGLGALANRFRLSPLVGYLIAGIVAGPYTPGFVGDAELAPQLAEIGVILLMFGVGLHFSLRDLISVRNIAIPGAIGQTAVATLLGWGLAELMGWRHIEGIIFGFSLATASTVVLLRAMEERRLLDTRRGKIAVGWLIVEDLICVIALVIIPPLATALGGSGSETESVNPLHVAKALAITLGKVAAFVAFMLIVGRKAIPWLLERIAGTGSRELFTLAVLSIAMGVAFASAELFGVSFALGAFFAGMLLNESEFSHQAAQDSLPMRDAFAVLFFVSVGMLFDPGILVEHPIQVLLTVLIIVFGKSLAAYLIVRAFGHPNGTALTISTSLAQIGEFAFIIAGLGLSLNILPKDGHDLVLAGALITIMLNPLLFMVLDRWEAKQDALAIANAAPEEEVVPMDICGHAIIVGYGRVGKHLSQLLKENGVPVVVVEDDADRVEQARSQDILTVRGNVANQRVMLESAPQRANLAIFAMPQALEAGEAIQRLKALNPEISILARAHSEVQVKHLLEHGADAAVLAERELAYSLRDMVMATPPYRALRTVSPA